MSDDLRTRIATAVWMRHRAEAFAQCGLDALAVPQHPIPNWAYGMADAVIRELGLRIEYGALDPTDSGRLSDDDDLVPLRGEVLKTRYITDWTEHG